MLIGLLTLAYLLFGHGNQTFLLNPNLEKNVSVYVKDKDRKTQIDQTIKQVKKTEDAFQKKAKDVYDKKLEELNKSKTSTANDFLQEYNQFYKDLAELQNNYVDAELKFRSLIKPNEWDSIMNKVMKTPDNAKTRKKLKEENNKLHDRLLSACNKHIPDAAGKAKAKSLVNEYSVKADSLANAYLDLNYKYIKAIRPYKVSRTDFEPYQTQMIGLRKNYSDYLVYMRFKLKDITPEKEWESLAGDLKTVFAYLGPGM